MIVGPARLRAWEEIEVLSNFVGFSQISPKDLKLA